ncbi:MAG TPA: hypothetical protein VFU40_13180, partial [Gemmatimonadales bacterium]|nr:hypothetical protein [Gemmatimonadales bacterium]
MNDRRYRQPGYRTDPNARPARREDPAPGGPPATSKNRAVSRCAECGAVLPITADSLTQCPNCRAELHACRQCTHFDPAQWFECAQPVAERVTDKRSRNECALFALMVTVERATSSASMRPDDVRRAF